MLNNVHFKSKFWFKIEKMGLFLVKKVVTYGSFSFLLKKLRKFINFKKYAVSINQLYHLDDWSNKLILCLSKVELVLNYGSQFFEFNFYY